MKCCDLVFSALLGFETIHLIYVAFRSVSHVLCETVCRSCLSSDVIIACYPGFALSISMSDFLDIF